jgi:hypothetical protein
LKSLGLSERSKTLLNLCFQEEDKKSFELRIEEAKVNRDKAEIALRYAYQIEHMNSPTPSL